MTSPNPAFLPLLRPDIEFLPGPDDPDGSPTYVIHDPLRGSFEKATWVQAQILKLLSVPSTVDRVLRQLSASTTIKVTTEDIERLCADASRRGLTIESSAPGLSSSEAREARPPRRWLETVLGTLMYVRIPLVNPDAFLARTVGVVRHLAHPGALAGYFIISLIGILLLLQRFDGYLATFPYFFNVRGVVSFAVAIVGVKLVHELSHAYVAKAFGIRVPSMGVALIFLLPMAYSDITDSWRMSSRRKRLLISLAGVLAELVIAGLALFAWTLSPPGIVKSLCFVISSTTLLSTLLVNLNPAMRFDGYYVLSDLLRIDNLQSRSFMVTRWALRRGVLGMKVASPEVRLSRRRLAHMIAYAAVAWVYRFFLYSGIALMLFHWVDRGVGIVLFLIAIYRFIARPVVMETIDLMKMRRRLGWNRRMIGVTIACGLAALHAIVPLPRWHTAPATTTPRNSQVIYTPSRGVIRKLDIGLGRPVRKGRTLFVIESEELRAQSELARLEVERIGIELAVIKSDEERRALLPQKTEELARAMARRASIRAAMERNRIAAEVDGVVVQWDPSVRNGTPVGANQVLGRIVDYRNPLVVCYVMHDLIADVAVNDRVYFSSKARPGRCPGVVTNVDPVRTKVLEHRGLSSISGGDIAVAPRASGQSEVTDSYYEVEVTLDRSGHLLRLGQTGSVWLHTAPRSRLADLFRYLHRVLIRESTL